MSCVSPSLPATPPKVVPLLNSVVDVCLVYGIDETSARELPVTEEGVRKWGEGGGRGGEEKEGRRGVRKWREGKEKGRRGGEERGGGGRGGEKRRVFFNQFEAILVLAKYLHIESQYEVRITIFSYVM